MKTGCCFSNFDDRFASLYNYEPPLNDLICYLCISNDWETKRDIEKYVGHQVLEMLIKNTFIYRRFFIRTPPLRTFKSGTKDQLYIRFREFHHTDSGYLGLNLIHSTNKESKAKKYHSLESKFKYSCNKNEFQAKK